MPQRILASLKSLVNNRKYLIELPFSPYQTCFNVLVREAPPNEILLLFEGGVNPLPGWFGALFFTVRTIQPFKSCPKKSAPECPFEGGGGVQSLFGQCPNRGDANFKGASLTSLILYCFIVLYQQNQ